MAAGRAPAGSAKMIAAKPRQMMPREAVVLTQKTCDRLDSKTLDPRYRHSGTT